MKAPEKITKDHEVEQFDCGEISLNEWLKKKALKNEDTNDSRTFVISEDQRVVGYYTIATGSMDHANAPSFLKRNAPNPISIIVLGRLAVDIKWQKKGLGEALLQDVIFKTAAVSKIAGVKALVVHAISENAKLFYLKNDFIASPIEMTLLLPVKDILKYV